MNSAKMDDTHNQSVGLGRSAPLCRTISFPRV